MKRTIGERLAEAAMSSVEHSGLWWRVRRITSADLAAAGAAALLAVRQTAADLGPAESDPHAAERTHRMLEAATVAALRQVSADGQTWEPYTVTREERAVNHRAGVYHLTDLPPGALVAIGAVALELSTDGEAARTRLASFLGG